jgi:hypothetical protein
MPPKDSRLDDIAPTAVLPLQDWLKLLSSRGVDMRVAMSLAAKMYVYISFSRRTVQIALTAGTTATILRSG